jgi:phosphoglycolate phosphatase
MPYSTLIFDLDGTLSDPAVGVIRCMNFALTSFDYAPLPEHEITQHIGPRWNLRWVN